MFSRVLHMSVYRVLKDLRKAPFGHDNGLQGLFYESLYDRARAKRASVWVVKGLRVYYLVDAY